jgi:hypothetical protein
MDKELPLPRPKGIANTDAPQRVRERLDKIVTDVSVLLVRRIGVEKEVMRKGGR